MPTTKVRKQLVKKRKEERRLLRKRAFQHCRTAFQKFPEIVYRDEGVPPRLAEAIKQLVRQFVIEHEAILSRAEADLFHRMRQVGCQRARREAMRRLSSGGSWTAWLDSVDDVLLYGIGDYVLPRLPSTLTEAYFPFSALDIIPSEPQPWSFLVRMRSLSTAKTPWGTAYFSPYRPTVAFRGHELIVSFSDHAVRRVWERTVGAWTRYAELVYGFWVLHDTVYFEPWLDRDDLRGFVLFAECHPINSDYRLVERLIENPDPKRTYCQRVGYCPADVCSPFLRARTLLLPGMANTPEYGRFRNDKSEAARELRQSVRQLERPTFAGPSGEAYLDLVKALHESGIPQVVSFDHPIMRNGL